MEKEQRVSKHDIALDAAALFIGMATVAAGSRLQNNELVIAYTLGGGLLSVIGDGMLMKEFFSLGTPQVQEKEKQTHSNRVKRKEEKLRPKKNPLLDFDERILEKINSIESDPSSSQLQKQEVDFLVAGRKNLRDFQNHITFQYSHRNTTSEPLFPLLAASSETVLTIVDSIVENPESMRRCIDSVSFPEEMAACFTPSGISLFFSKNPEHPGMIAVAVKASQPEVCARIAQMPLPPLSS